MYHNIKIPQADVYMNASQAEKIANCESFTTCEMKLRNCMITLQFRDIGSQSTSSLLLVKCLMTITVM